MSEKIAVIPCYNEASRLDFESFFSFLKENPDWSLLFVDDGSSDQTSLAIKENIRHDRCDLIRLYRNSGKAEAIRQGILVAASSAARYIAFLDADLATPLSGLIQVQKALEEKPDYSAALASRVRLAGTHIERKALRHYLGRVFATIVGSLFSFLVFDSQCGCKVFRNSSDLKALFEEKFISRWVFDVEILCRLFRKTKETAFFEVPIPEWKDKRGSKLSHLDFIRALFDLFRIRLRYPQKG